MSDTSTPLPAAGWYADPQDSAQLRYWDGAQWTEQVRPLVTQQAPVEVAAQEAQPAQPAQAVQAAQYSGPQVLVATSSEIPGYRIVTVAGEVCGLTVRTHNAISSAGASFRTTWGGEAQGYTQLLLDSRREAVNRLKAEAAAVGANAVVAMRYDSGEIADLLNEVAAYGTAVTVEPV